CQRLDTVPGGLYVGSRSRQVPADESAGLFVIVDQEDMETPQGQAAALLDGWALFRGNAPSSGNALLTGNAPLSVCREGWHSAHEQLAPHLANFALRWTLPILDSSDYGQ